jgi:hypothetical protein
MKYKILYITSTNLNSTSNKGYFASRLEQILSNKPANYDFTVLSLPIKPQVFSTKNKLLHFIDRLTSGLIYIFNDKFILIRGKYKKAIIKELTTNSHDLVILQIYPISFITLSSTIKKYNKSNRMMLDISDPIVANSTFRDWPWPRKLITRHYENKYIPLFNGLFVLNKEIKQYFEERFPSMVIKVVEFGIDKNVVSPPKSPEKKDEKLKLLYAGVFYKNLRNPSNLYKAILAIDYPIELSVFGKSEFNGMLPSKDSRFLHREMIPKATLNKLYQDYDIIVFIDNFYGIQIPGKTLEILALNKPILFIYENEESPTFNYARKYNGIFYTKNNPEEIKKTIAEIKRANQWVYERNLKNYYWENILTPYYNFIGQKLITN